jgi:hypothetical protein
MYYFDGTEREKYEDTEACYETHVVYIYCPVHGLTGTVQGYCEECVVEVYEAYLNGGIS